MEPTQRSGIYTDARRFTLLWIRSRRQVVAAVAHRVAVAAVVEVLALEQAQRAAEAVQQAQPRALEQVLQGLDEVRVLRLLPFLARLRQQPVRLR